jgi:hypothetical protein
MSDFDALDSSQHPPDDAVAQAAQEKAGRGGYPAPGYPDAMQGGPEEPHLLDYVRVLYKRRWVAGTAFTVVFLLVTRRTRTSCRSRK